MDVYILTALASIIIAGALIISINRANILLVVVLLCSSFLGFIDPLSFTARGLFDIHLLFLALIFATLAASYNKFNEIKNTQLKTPLAILIILLIYGIATPIIKEHSSAFYAIKASKEYIMILWYISAFLYIRDIKSINLAWKYLIYTGVFYTAIEIMAQIVAPTMMNIMSYGFRKEFFVFWKVYVPFWPFILILLFVSLYQSIFKMKNNHYMLFLGVIGLFLTFFRSYFLASIAVVPLVLLLHGKGSVKHLSKAVVSSIIVLIGIVVLTLTLGNEKVLTELTDRFVTSGITEISSQSGGAIEGRERYAEGRYELRDQEPLFGYGFIDKDSSFGLQARRIISGDLIGFIDKGTLDVTIKFGYIGGAILYIAFLLIAFRLIKLSKEDISDSLKARLLTCASLTFTFLIVQPVHAPLTNSFALLPYMIALGLIERQYILEKREDNNREKHIDNDQGVIEENSTKYESVKLR